MTLLEWADKQPVLLNTYNGQYLIPDVMGLVDRARAWHLSDYLVSAVSGGVIWFIEKE